MCISDEETVQKWKECVKMWRELVHRARQKHDFSDHEIEAFQSLCDSFYLKWIDLQGEDGVGNYIHMLGAGHFEYYFKKWRHLYCYSLQGWEGLNYQIKQIYFCRTQRGGHNGDGEFNSKVEPIAKWVQRSMFWKMGMGKDEFEDDI